MPRPEPDWRLCVAPMLDLTDRHCRFFHRQLSPHARLYTEMVTTGALLHGEVARHLRHDPAEHPLALQLGGAVPDALARCAALGAGWGYDEINLNCGCPSDRVQEGRFGACLMREPQQVAAAVAAMRRACGIPVTVKCRIGIDDNEEFGFLLRFVEAVAAAGCETFVIHARNAWLQGLSPRENREIPPLRYEIVYRLKQVYPRLTVVLNGGIRSAAACVEHLRHVDGVMLGREVYENPYRLAELERALFGTALPPREEVLASLRPYVAAELAAGTALARITRHVLGIYRGEAGARAFRRALSVGGCRKGAGLEVLDEAIARVATALQRAA